MSLYKKTFAQFKEMYYLGVVLGIIASSCAGSIAAALALRGTNGALDIVQLCLAVAVSMWFNAAVLAQMKHKLVFDSLIFSLAVNTLIIVLHLF